MKDKLDIQFKFFAGSPRKGEWAGIHYYSPQVPAIYENRGEIAAALSLSGPVNFDSSKAGNLLIDYLHETYFESEAESSLVALKEAVEKVRERLIDFMLNDEASSEAGVEISLIATAIQEEYLYIAQLGEAKAYAWREGKVTNFSEHLKDLTGKSQVKTGSVALKEDDRILLVSDETDFNLTDIEKKRVLEGFNLDPIEGKVFSNEAQIAAIILGYEVKQIVNEEKGIEDKAQVISTYKDLNESLQDEAFEEEIMDNEELVTNDVGEKNNVMIENIDEDIKIDHKTVPSKGFKFNINEIGTHLNRVRRDQRTKTFFYILSTAGVGIYNLLTKAGKFFWNSILKMDGSGYGGIYLKGASRRDMNWRPLIFLGVVLIVAGIIIFKSVQGRREAAKIDLENKTAIEKVETEVEELGSQVDILTKTVGKEEEKVQILSEFEEMGSVLDAVTLEKYSEQKSNLVAQVNGYQNKLVRRIPVSDPVIIKDFGIYEGSDPEDFTIGENGIYVADKGGGKIISMDFEGGDLRSLAENLQNPRGITLYENREVIFVDDNEERAVGIINLENSQLERLPGLSAGRLGNINEMTIYEVAEGDTRLYATRAGTKELIQMRRGTQSFNLPELRLNRSDFTELVDTDVNNGRIYVLSQGQGARRFLGDTEFNTTVAGMLEGDSWNNADSMFVDVDYIYLGDSQNKRVLVFTKARGENSEILDFVAQYDLSSIEGANSIKEVVSDRVKNKLYVMLGTKLIELDLGSLSEFTY